MSRIMKPEDYRYTWELSSRAWYVRLFRWIWTVESAEVTWCKRSRNLRSTAYD